MKGRTRPSPCGSKKILRHPENPPWGTAQPGEVPPFLSGREPFRASQCGAPPDCGQGSEAESDSTNDVRVLLLVRGGRTDNRRRLPPGVAGAQHRDLPGLHGRLQPAIPKDDKHHDHGPGSVSHGQGSGHSRQCHFHLLAPLLSRTQSHRALLEASQGPNRMAGVRGLAAAQGSRRPVDL